MLRYDARYDVFVGLKERIQSSSGAVYILMDPMSRCDLSMLNGFKRKRYTVDLERFGMRSELCPYVLEVESMNDDVLKESVNVAWEHREDWQKPQPVCGWISSPLSASALASAILVQAVTTAADRTRHLNRFYDPRVARHATFALTVSEDFPGALRGTSLAGMGNYKNCPAMFALRVSRRTCCTRRIRMQNGAYLSTPLSRNCSEWVSLPFITRRSCSAQFARACRLVSQPAK